MMWFAETIRYGIAPVVLFLSGFFTADFLVSGVYTWPRTSRLLVLTITIAVLAYEFVYKEQRAAHPERAFDRQLRVLFYSCILPYGLGGMALLAVARLIL